MTPRAVWRVMTADERRMIDALAACTFMPSNGDRQTTRELAFLSAQTERRITVAQAAALRLLVEIYRRQIPGEVAALALDSAVVLSPRQAERGLPSVMSLFGSCPNLTGGLDAVEYVRRQRDALPDDDSSDGAA